MKMSPYFMPTRLNETSSENAINYSVCKDWSINFQSILSQRKLPHRCPKYCFNGGIKSCPKPDLLVFFISFVKNGRIASLATCSKKEELILPLVPLIYFLRPRKCPKTLSFGIGNTLFPTRN